jgi:hypothetical protein
MFSLKSFAKKSNIPHRGINYFFTSNQGMPYFRPRRKRNMAYLCIKKAGPATVPLTIKRALSNYPFAFFAGASAAGASSATSVAASVAFFLPALLRRVFLAGSALAAVPLPYTSL